MPATLDSLSPSSGKPGDTIVLAGSGFVAGAIVTYASTVRTLTDDSPTVVSDTEIRSVVPDVLEGLAGAVQVSVTNANDSASNTLPFSLEAVPSVGSTQQLCSLGELRKFLGIAPDETIDADRLRELITIASAQIIGYCQRDFQLVTVTDELVDGTGANVLRLSRTPIVAVTALTIDGEPVDVGELRIYDDYIKFEDAPGYYNPRLRSTARYFPAGVQNITVSYQAGYAEVPPEIAHACMLQVVYLQNLANKQGIISETNPVAQTTTQYSQAQLAPAVKVICNRFRRPKLEII